jgi:O-antigen/teichoic acid export membrane protein
VSRFARNTAYSTLAGVCYSLGAFATSIIVARLLGVHGAGTVAFATWIVAITVALTDLGIFAALTRFLPELTHDGRREEAATLTSYLFLPFWLAAMSAFALYATVALWPPLQGVTVHVFGPGADSVLWLLIGTLCLGQSLATFMQGYWRGMQQFDQAARVVLVSALLQLLSVTAGCLAFGAAGAVGGLIGGQVVGALMCIHVARRGAAIGNDLRRRAARHAVYSWAGSLASTIVWSRVELAFLNSYFGPEQVGFFAVGLSLAAMAVQGPTLLTGGLLAHLAENYGKRNFQALRDTARIGTRMLAFLVLPMCFGMAAILPELLPFIYGKPFSGAGPAAEVLVASAALGASAAVATNVVIAYERTDIIALNGAIGIILTMLVGLFVIPHFGLMGAAWGRAAVQLVIVVIGFWFVERRLECPLPWTHIARLALAAAVCAAAARTTTILLPGVFGLPAAILVGGMVYLLAVYLLRALPEEDLRHLWALSANLADKLRARSTSLG